MTTPFLSVQGEPEQQASARRGVQTHGPLFSPCPGAPLPALPPLPIPSLVSPWVSPFPKINRFFRLKARHLFGEAPRDGTVGPTLTLDF